MLAITAVVGEEMADTVGTVPSFAVHAREHGRMRASVCELTSAPDARASCEIESFDRCRRTRLRVRANSLLLRA